MFPAGKFAQARHPEVTFSFLSSLTRLQSLHLAGFELSGIDPFLAPLTNLTRVHLRGYDRNFVPVPALSALTGLRHLKLALPFIFPCVLGLEAITALTGLRYLSLAQSVTEGDDVSYLSALKALEVLEIEYFSDPFSQVSGSFGLVRVCVTPIPSDTVADPSLVRMPLPATPFPHLSRGNPTAPPARVIQRPVSPHRLDVPLPSWYCISLSLSHYLSFYLALTCSIPQAGRWIIRTCRG
jgi:hypothetical protein